MSPLETWIGLEYTVNRIQDQFINQCDKNLQQKKKRIFLTFFGHWQLTDEAMEQPEIDLAAALKKYRVSAESFFYD